MKQYITEAKPEEGRLAVSNATALDPDLISHGLELMIRSNGFRKLKPYLPRPFQILSEQPVPVTVLHIWDMSKIDRGFGIHRYRSEFGVPYAHYTHPK